MPLEGCFLIGEFLRDFWRSWFFDSKKISLRKCLRIPAQQRLTGFRCISPSLSCENQQIHEVWIIRHLNRAISTSENDHPSPPVFSHCPNCLNPQDEQSCERSLTKWPGFFIWHTVLQAAVSCFSMVAWRSFKEKPFRQARNAAWDNMKLPLLRVMMQWNKSGGLFQLKLA